MSLPEIYLLFQYVFKSANVSALPDKGERLRQNVERLEKAIEQLKLEQEEMQEDESLLDHDYAVVKDEPTTSKAGENWNQGNVDPVLEFDGPMNLGDMGKKALEKYERQQTMTQESLQKFHKTISKVPTEEDLAEDPKGLKVPLLPHQKRALAWLIWRENEDPPGGILGIKNPIINFIIQLLLLQISVFSRRHGSGKNADNDITHSGPTRKRRP